MFKDYQVVKIGQLLEIGLADVFGKALDAGLLPAFRFRIDLSIEKDSCSSV